MGKSAFRWIGDQINRWKFCSSRSRPVSPCLVLKPQLIRGEMVYQFYSFEEQKVVQRKKRAVGSGRVDEPADASKIVGSSHGWLALLNESNNELFLSDLLKRQHIRLPTIEKLPNPEMNRVAGRGSVTKLILSCPPDEDGVAGKQCRALMSYGALDSLAFCSPLSKSVRRWTPVSDLWLDRHRDHCPQAKYCSDMVYCTKRGVFSSITPLLKIVIDSYGVNPTFGKYGCLLEDLDLSPKLVNAVELSDWIYHDDELPLLPSWLDDMRKDWAVQTNHLVYAKDWPVQTNHLVYAEESGTLYLLVRLMDGSPPVPRDGNMTIPYSINDPSVISKYGDGFACKTVGFVALRIDYNYSDGDLSVAESLEGLAMFVGDNHSFAIPASKYPELNLKPDSIYFTDVEKRVKGPGWSGKEGGRDVGIFDYQNNIVSPLSEESSEWLQHHDHAPLWFTPSIVV